MTTRDDPVQRHYGGGDCLSAILAALRDAGKDPRRLKPADLAAVDEFHVRGREATIELATHAGLAPGQRVLDVGCGLGGSARHLAAEHGCTVTGVDLTPEYVDAARALSDLVGLGGRVSFRQASALELPLADASFDLVWTEHVQMNIADKAAFYREIVRVIAPGGRLAFHDIFRGPGGPPHFPLPWAERPDISFLADAEAVRELLAGMGLTVRLWEDKSALTADWFAATLARLRRNGRPPLGMHLVMGANAALKSESLLRSLREARVKVIQAVLVRG